MLVPPVFSPAVVLLLLPVVFSVLLLLVFLLPILVPVMVPVMFSVLVSILLPAVLLLLPVVVFLLPVVVLVPFLGGSQVTVAQSLTHNPLRFLRRGLYAKRWVSGR